MTVNVYHTYGIDCGLYSNDRCDVTSTWLDHKLLPQFCTPPITFSSNQMVLLVGAREAHSPRLGINGKAFYRPFTLQVTSRQA